MVVQSYRQSHASDGCGERYQDAFRSGYYARQWFGIELSIVTRLLEREGRAGAETTLDFACGTGRILALHEDAFPRSVGVDVSEEMLRVARQACPRSQLVRLDLTRADPDTADFGPFDVVTAFRFFLNAEPDLRLAALEAIRRHLKDSGTLIVNFHVNSAGPTGVAYRLRNGVLRREVAHAIGHAEAMQLLDSAGFAVEETIWYGLWPRLGWHADWLNARLMVPAEGLAARFPSLRRFSQCFILVAHRR